jgi:LPS-assembly lipoprotein
MAAMRQADHPTHPSRVASRRTWLARSTHLAATLAAGALLSATGCGFQLQRGQAMAFKTIQLAGFAGNSSLANELGTALEDSGVSVVDSTLAATQAASSATVPSSHVVIEALTDRQDAVVSTTTAYGQIRNMTARNALTFTVKRGDGSVLLPATTVGLSRDLSYNEKDALAKQDELAALHKAMQSDMVNQVLRRLSAIRADQLLTPAAPSSARAPNVHTPSVSASAPTSR